MISSTESQEYLRLMAHQGRESVVLLYIVTPPLFCGMILNEYDCLLPPSYTKTTKIYIFLLCLSVCKYRLSIQCPIFTHLSCGLIPYSGNPDAAYPSSLYIDWPQILTTNKSLDLWILQESPRESQISFVMVFYNTVYMISIVWTWGLSRDFSTFVVLYIDLDIPRLPLVSCTNHSIYIYLFADCSLAQRSVKIFPMGISPKTWVTMNDSVDKD